MLVGKQAPLFSCKAAINGQIQEVSLEQFQGMRVLFFYPSDFTFVCPTELHAFQDALPEFEKRKTTVLGVSVDSAYCHCAWLEQPKEEGGIKGIAYPLLSDCTKSISRAYDVLNEEEGIAYRGLFIIDQNRIIQSAHINNVTLGRNIDEILRLIDAIRFVQEHGEVCPANWLEGQKGLEATHEGVKAYFKK